MARNLQAKLPSTDTLRVYDINVESVNKFANETRALSGGAAVEVASSVREAAEDSVSFSATAKRCSSYDEFVPNK